MPRLILFSTLNPETLRQLNLLRKPTDDEDRRKLQRHRKLFAVVLLVGVATASLLTNQKLDLMIGTERVKLQQLERKLFAGEDLTDAEREEFCRLLRIVKQVFLADCTADNIAAYFQSDKAFVYDFKPPNKRRHEGLRITERTFVHRNKSKKNSDPRNSVADNTVDLDADGQIINRGLAEKLPNGKFKLPNGRIYGTQHAGGSDRLYPVEGPGIKKFTNTQLTFLGKLNDLHHSQSSQMNYIVDVMVKKSKKMTPRQASEVIRFFEDLHNVKL